MPSAVKPSAENKEHQRMCACALTIGRSVLISSVQAQHQLVAMSPEKKQVQSSCQRVAESANKQDVYAHVGPSHCCSSESERQKDDRHTGPISTPLSCRPCRTLPSSDARRRFRTTNLQSDLASPRLPSLSLMSQHAFLLPR